MDVEYNNVSPSWEGPRRVSPSLIPAILGCSSSFHLIDLPIPTSEIEADGFYQVRITFNQRLLQSHIWIILDIWISLSPVDKKSQAHHNRWLDSTAYYSAAGPPAVAWTVEWFWSVLKQSQKRSSGALLAIIGILCACLLCLLGFCCCGAVGFIQIGMYAVAWCPLALLPTSSLQRRSCPNWSSILQNGIALTCSVVT